MKDVKTKDNLMNYTVKSDNKTYEFEVVFLGTQKLKKNNK